MQIRNARKADSGMGLGSGGHADEAASELLAAAKKVVKVAPSLSEVGLKKLDRVQELIQQTIEANQESRGKTK